MVLEEGFNRKALLEIVSLSKILSIKEMESTSQGIRIKQVPNYGPTSTGKLSSILLHMSRISTSHT